jgi:hypothetical protein
MRSVLSTRPISAKVTRQPCLQKSKALYDFTDQIEALRQKELSLEKAKTNLFQAAEQ